MVNVTCEKTGLVFEAATRRTKNHPSIMFVLGEANKGGWYTQALDAIKRGREAGFTTVEQFVAAMRDAESAFNAEQRAAYSAEVSQRLAREEAARQRHILNEWLRESDYHWSNLGQSAEELEDGFDIFVNDDEAPAWQLFDRDNKPVSIKQAMQREYAASESKFARTWLTERNLPLQEEKSITPVAQLVLAEQKEETPMTTLNNLAECLQYTGDIAESSLHGGDTDVFVTRNDDDYIASYGRPGMPPHTSVSAPTLEQLLAENPELKDLHWTAVEEEDEI